RVRVSLARGPGGETRSAGSGRAARGAVWPSARWKELARLDVARLFDSVLDFGEQAIGGRKEPLGRFRAPPCHAHIMHQGLHRLATALFGDQLLIGELPGAEIAHAEVEQVPREADA